MNNIPLFISRFLYRIRYQLIFGSLIVTILVAYFTQFLPKSYTVNTTIYTGIVSMASLEGDGSTSNYQIVNNTFDNLISLLRSQSTLESVALHLFAMDMMYGNKDKDNEYITAQNYQRLQERVPDEIKSLIDKKSVEKTVANLRKSIVPVASNFMYALLNGHDRHYSYAVLNTVQIKRIGNSDMIDLSYQSDDPGIAATTVKLFNKELLNNYNELRYRATNDVIEYFRKQVEKKRKELKEQEDALTKYNVENNIINYSEQTKATAHAFSNYEDRYEATLREFQSSQKLLESLNKQMETRTKLFHTNQDFLKALNKVSVINGKITEIEMFTTGNKAESDVELLNYKRQLKEAERKISQISDNIDEYQYSKEGVAIPEMVSEWLKALINNTKSKAELKVLDERLKDFHNKYTTFSPVGTDIKRREREINVTEQSYLEMLHFLNLAYLRKKNIELTTAGLNTVTEPSFPLGANKSKRLLFIIAAFIGSLVFITAYNLLIEILDRTLRDAQRTQQLTGTKVCGIFSGRSRLRYRGYAKNWNRISAAYLCNKIDNLLEPGKTIYINLMSIEPQEGKSYIAKFLIEEWEKQGLNACYLKAGEDFPMDASYILAASYHDLKPGLDTANLQILLVEYPALQLKGVPTSLLTKASLNLIVANAKRVWKKSDEEVLNHLEEVAGKSSVCICLNNADREAVEDYTGKLPPRSSGHLLAVQMMHMGLTAKGDAVK